MAKKQYYEVQNSLQKLLPKNGDKIKIALDRAKKIFDTIEGNIPELSSLLSNGNRKIGNDTLIFNVTSAHKCPSDKLGLCGVSNKCYAKKAENQYWFTVGNYRENQMRYWDNTTAKEFVDELVPIILSKSKIKFIRFNEAGDMKNQSDITKLISIRKRLTKELKKYNRVVQIYTYTARKDLNWITAMKTPGLTINGSGFMLSNNFNLVRKKEDKIGNFTCIGDCRICNLCKYSKNKVININIH